MMAIHRPVCWAPLYPAKKPSRFMGFGGSISLCNEVKKITLAHILLGTHKSYPIHRKGRLDKTSKSSYVGWEDRRP